MGDYLLGLDAGNTVIKAVIFDREGKEIASAAAEGHSRCRSPAMSSAAWTSFGRMPAGSSVHVSLRPGSTPARSRRSAAPAMATGLRA